MAALDENDHRAVWKAQSQIAKGSGKPNPKLEQTLREAIAAGREAAHRIESRAIDGQG